MQRIAFFTIERNVIAHSIDAVIVRPFVLHPAPDDGFVMGFDFLGNQEVAEEDQ